MKVSISYMEDESREADLIYRAVRDMLPSIKVRKSDRHPPFKQLYLTTKFPYKPCKSKERT